MLRRACEAAPGPTEAGLCEQLSQQATGASGHSAASMEIVSTYMPEVLQVRGGGEGAV